MKCSNCEGNVSYTEQDIHTALTRELTDERVAVAAAYWLDASPHERWEPDGIVLARYARYAMTEIERLRAALEDIRYQIQQSDHPSGLGILAMINQAISTTTEPTGAQRVRDKMKSLFEAWDLRGICKDSLEGYEQGVMLELIGMCEEIAGINATEKEENNA